MEQAVVDGIQLAYEEVGSGDPVVFIHGVLIADAFRPLLDERVLTGRYRLVSYHRRGYRGSSRSRQPFGFAGHAADCARLLERLGLEPVHVAGHSFGASIALQLALDAPQLVQTLSLLEPGLLVGESSQRCTGRGCCRASSAIGRTAPRLLSTSFCGRAGRSTGSSSIGPCRERLRRRLQTPPAASKAICRVDSDLSWASRNCAGSGSRRSSSSARGSLALFFPARIIRAQVLSLREKEFVEAARMVGARDTRIIRSHVLPHLTGPIIVYSTLVIASNTLLETSLSFFGLGVKPPTASWGNLLSTGPDYYLTQPWLMVWPGAAVLLTTLAFNLLGDGLRDALDPRSSS